MLRLAIDVCGGDFGIRSSLPAARRALASHDDLHLTLVGPGEELEREARSLDLPTGRYDIRHAADSVPPDEKPSTSLRHRRDSSLWVTLELLRERAVSGAVSAGNTGALVAMGRYLLQTLPGIDRPAICAPIPGRGDHTYLLDLGANVDCSAAELRQFAIMGSALATAVDGIERPRVALLNIGEEVVKGNRQVRTADGLLRADSLLNYIGYVEAHDIFGDRADVVVCDGFVGNVALKASEGAATLIGEQLKGRFSSSWYGIISGLFVRPLLAGFHRHIDPQAYNGAALLGLRGVVVKSHGASTEHSFASAIGHAARAVGNRLPEQIEQQLSVYSSTADKKEDSKP